MERSDRAIQREEAKLAKEETHQLLNGLLYTAAAPAGRRWLWHLLASAGIYSPSYADNALRTAYNEGRRSLGLEILNLLTEEAPEAYLLMQKEHADDYRNRLARFAAINARFAGDPDDPDGTD